MSAAILDRSASTAPVAVPAPFAFTPSRKRVFGSHSEMAHVWASLDVEDGRSADDRMQFDNGSIFSYGRHFEIARFLPFTVDGRRVVLFTLDRRSVSTAKHIRYTAGALDGHGAIVIHVPDLQTWQATPAQVAAVWESLVREVAHGPSREWRHLRTVDAFRALYAPAAVMPADPKAWVAARDAELADAKAVVRLQDALSVIQRDCVDIVRGGYGPDAERSLSVVDAALDARSFGTNSDMIETRLKRVRSALVVVRKFPEHADAAKVGAAYVKAWTVTRKAWEAVEETARVERERAERVAAIEACLIDHRSGNPSWRSEGEFLAGRIRDAVTYGMGDAVVELTRFASLAAALDEMTSDHIVPDWQAARRYSRKPITAAEWQDGAGSASFPQSSEYGPRSAGYGVTMVRRKGDTLETSRGATAPFAQAVTVYRAAALIRRGVRAGDAIGQRVGHYRLDAVDAEGNITVGCHRIAFAEMERLACREVPHLVRARFPVPAVIA